MVVLIKVTRTKILRIFKEKQDLSCMFSMMVFSRRKIMCSIKMNIPEFFGEFKIREIEKVMKRLLIKNKNKKLAWHRALKNTIVYGVEGRNLAVYNCYYRKAEEVITRSQKEEYVPKVGSLKMKTFYQILWKIFNMSTFTTKDSPKYRRSEDQESEKTDR